MSREFRLACAVLFCVVSVVGSMAIGGCSSADKDDVSKDPAEQTSGETASEEGEWVVTLLDGYPEDTVPLYEMTLLDTCLFSVRNDPSYAAEGLRNFYHVVFNSSAEPSDVMDHYREMMSSVDQDRTTDEQVVGTIGDYEVVVRSSIWSDKTIVYMTVDLPDGQLSEDNPFFSDYPADVVEVPEPFVFFEEMFYRVLLRNTDMSYTRHFDIADLDGDGLADLDEDARYAFFEERYSDKEDFLIDRDAEQITWIDGIYHVTVAYTSDYDRGVLVLGFDAE